MRAYAGTVDHQGLRWFLPEEVIPRDLLRHSVRAGWTGSTTAVWALVADDDAEAIRADLSAGRYGDACNLILNRAVELLSPFRTSRPLRHSHEPVRLIAGFMLRDVLDPMPLPAKPGQGTLGLLDTWMRAKAWQDEDREVAS
jgi:hypothetical protein